MPEPAAVALGTIRVRRSRPVSWSTKHQRQSSPGSAERITSWPAVAWWALACRSGEESQQAMWPQTTHIRRCTQAGALAQAVAALARGVRRRPADAPRWRCSQSPSRASAMPLARTRSRSLRRSSRASTPRCRASTSTSSTTSWATLPVSRTSSDPRALGVDHQLAPAGVDVARRLVRARPEPLPRGVVAAQHAVADLVADARAGRPPRACRARRARPARPGAAGWPGPARRRPGRARAPSAAARATAATVPG